MARLVALALCLACAAPAVAQEDFRVLVFSKTAGFRHGSIGAGTALVQSLGAANNFGVDTTEDANQFNDANLAGYAVVIWLNTTGDVLNGAQQGAFERQDDGKYRVNPDLFRAATTDLSSLLLQLQGDGDYAGAAQLVKEKGVIGRQLQAELDRLSEKGIPVDIVFEQGVDVLGL